MTDVASREESVAGEPRPSARRWWRDAPRVLAQQNGFWIFVVLVALVAFFSLSTPSGTFFSVFNLQTLLGDGSETLILATGALLVIIAGGIDLSAGSLMTLSGVVGFLVMKDIGASENQQGQIVWGNGWLAIILGIAVGIAATAAWGALNGGLVAYAKIPPFVVTLGSLGAALGAARLLVKGESFASTGPDQFTNTLGISKVAGVPTPFVIGIVIAAAFGLLLAITRFGERIYLVGSNAEAARRAGVRVGFLQLRVYLLSGALAGTAGMVDFARFNTVDISTGHTQALIASIAAVIIGGASLMGGIGTMPGTVIAVFIPVVLNNGLIIRGTQPFWQDIAVGAILVAAVGFDQWRRSARTRAPRWQRFRSPTHPREM
jgi:ribose transport system permease protein